MLEHHWLGKLPDPKNYFGFIYEIENTVNGRKYIGKKQYLFYRLKKVLGKSRKVRVTIPSKWEFYTGSCKELNRDIKKLGKDKFRFRILWNCSSKGMLTYMEVKEQILQDVLIGTIEGTELPRYYNQAISSNIKFIPRGEVR